MIVGIGVDAVNISRIERLSETAIRKMFSEKEIEQYAKLDKAVSEVRNQFLASRFAVKEAYAKARGLGFGEEISPRDITTEINEKGAPYIVLSGKTLEKNPGYKMQVSITHEDPLAIAFVVLEKE